MDDQDGAGRLAHHRSGDRAQQGAAQPGPSVRPHDDQIASLLAREPDELPRRIAREEGCDLIVMGTHGRTGLRRALMGSVAAAVVREAPCAVLVVHDGTARIAREEREELAQYL